MTSHPNCYCRNIARHQKLANKDHIEPGKAAMTVFITFAFIAILALGTLPISTRMR